jgi:hypothetical protein
MAPIPDIPKTRVCHTRRSGGMNACLQVVGLKASITPSPKANRGAINGIVD